MKICKSKWAELRTKSQTRRQTKLPGYNARPDSQTKFSVQKREQNSVRANTSNAGNSGEDNFHGGDLHRLYIAMSVEMSLDGRGLGLH
jgi:hypothetical protein